MAYFGNYPGSSSGYDPNIPTGYNKWDEQDYTDEPSYRPPEQEDEQDEFDEVEYPRKEFSENTVIVTDLGNWDCVNSENK